MQTKQQKASAGRGFWPLARTEHNKKQRMAEQGRRPAVFEVSKATRVVPQCRDMFRQFAPLQDVYCNSYPGTPYPWHFVSRSWQMIRVLWESGLIRKGDCEDHRRQQPMLIEF